ncbi:hypothetical protein [Prevotella sp. P6B1]|uniref:hypothetical protein n=1 Tax=Prevotella sp. P6B1 TaxID=1410613 RepID=UPI0012DC51F6|nr:hypothetical protein [Prevotella sp. P6B1]
MPTYLRQWLIHRHGGCEPISLVRGSAESDFLKKSTVKLPDGIIPPTQQEGEVAIAIPYYKSHDPRTYNYLSDIGKNCLLQMLKNDFKVDLWEYLHDIDRCGSELNALIYQFMELRGIKEDGTTSDSIKKIYQRKKNCFRTIQKRKNFKNHSDFK